MIRVLMLIPMVTILLACGLIPNPPIHTGGRREDSGRV